ncbi:pilus assembly protein [Acidithiobacillus sp. CV18-2]|uniref:Pilus assembly protein n=1 Tax=Igneacidithiobacillus copahuensis TaxID=2724909 RepID=A0AAE3CKV3_9PROT|nr:pilus assembly protein [Igneacidithiobacillus copahuensis]MBU2753198.1 pilus assembly protein [Acidithiobacillus sp. CV18-3]MBU2758504.1 pilus assembly protein [Acidithiobacillus sp. BN09-2]MBU2777607.1 pilus assembly protein [Acidithiobacillus sp. CV18-2]MBU2797701.1 pilus assembly protein [Acidithiobacillus sp. VAN18-2]MBU2798283.1 pilus assembly protein [Acidithiobacillus sp. VAN18-4]UTV80692.1 pilus assembly protein [Acidithiobacillus sp. YTS05]
MKQKFIAVKKSVREAGQGMTEYLIVVALIAISAIAVFSFFGQTMRHQVAGIAAELSGTDSGTNVSNAKGTASDANSKGTVQKSMGDYSSANVLNGTK